MAKDYDYTEVETADLVALLDYLKDDEFEDWVAEGRPDDHIYLVIERLEQALVPANYGPRRGVREDMNA